MAYGTVNADTLVTSTSGGILGAGNASILKNRIINGSMVIDQRNAGASVTPNNSSTTFPVDRFYVGVSQNSKLTAQQNAGSITPPIGFTKYLGITSSSAYSINSTDLFNIAQRIEGYNVADLNWGSANAKTVTLSFWAYSSLTGTFGGSLLGAGGARAYPFSYTISSANTWQQISITIAGDTQTGNTWNTTNGIGFGVYFSLGAGSAFQSTAGAWASGEYYSPSGCVSVVGTNGATFYITGVQLEVGSSATGFEYVNYQTSLANCQRYYENIALNTPTFQEYAFQASTATSAQGTIPFKVPKRAAPTVAIIGTVYSQNASMGSSAQATISAYSATTTSNGIRITASSSLYTAGNVCGFYNYDGGANTGFSFTAEL